MQDQNHQDRGPHDPWASLAESLGVGPTGESAPTPPAAPRPASPARSEKRPPRPAQSRAASWDSLASDLGVESGSSQAPAAPRPRPEQRGRPEESVPERIIERSEFDDRGDAPRDGESTGSDDGGRTRGRRRRGRRGGRGRRDRETSAGPRPESGLRSVDADRRERDGHDRDLAAADAFEAGAHDHDVEPAADRGDAWASAGGERPAASTESTGEADRPRRRRRGRRGGRGRGRSERDRVESAGQPGQHGSDRDAERIRPERDRPSDAGRDDEPLPTSYGMRPAGRGGDESAGDRDRQPAPRGDEEGGAGTRGRRRRRRRGTEARGTESRTGEGRAAAPAARERNASSREGRRDRRSRGRGESDPRSSGYARGRRSDFAPVAGGYDEDDEGLEFLGIEDAGHERSRRDSRPEDDDVLAESGLNTVRDVPSWVEAIGIVIAGNLDARNRSGRQDGGRGR